MNLKSVSILKKKQKTTILDLKVQNGCLYCRFENTKIKMLFLTFVLFGEQHKHLLSQHLSTCREERQDSSPQRPLFYRVLRAAFPLHLLFFMLLVLACLVPLSEENYSCTLTNNFARSFYPMLHYTNGPPPT